MKRSRAVASERVQTYLHWFAARWRFASLFVTETTREAPEAVDTELARRLWATALAEEGVTHEAAALLSSTPPAERERQVMRACRVAGLRRELTASVAQCFAAERDPLSPVVIWRWADLVLTEDLLARSPPKPADRLESLLLPAAGEPLRRAGKGLSRSPADATGEADSANSSGALLAEMGIGGHG